jgi:lambda family phage portal protein
MRAASIATARARRNAIDRFARDAESKFYQRFGKTAYRGADQHDKGHWQPEDGTADDVIIPELQTLRERSRDLNRNDPFAAALTRSVTDLVIGLGFRPQCRINAARLGITPQQAKEFQDAAEFAWSRWEESCDIAGRMHFAEMQALLFRSMWEGGDVFVNLPFLPDRVRELEGRPYGLAVEIVEADRIDSPFESGRASPDIRAGVEVGVRGQHLAYWVAKTPQGSRYFRDGNEFKRVRRLNEAGRVQMLQLMLPDRSPQTRGVPIYAPVLAMFDDLGGFWESEYYAARIQACLSAWITTPDSATTASKLRQKNDRSRSDSWDLEPLAVNVLEPGMEPKFATPNRPGGTFEPFVLASLRAIGAAVGFPLEVFAKDYSRTNFHSGRAALLDTWRTVQRYQQSFSNQLLKPLWRLVMEEAWLRGDLPDVPMMDAPHEWTRVRFIPANGRMMIEPDKELKATEHALKLGLTTLADEASVHGRDWEEVLEQQVREAVRRREILDQYGLTEADLVVGDQLAAAPPASAEPAPEEPEADEPEPETSGEPDDEPDADEEEEEDDDA